MDDKPFYKRSRFWRGFFTWGAFIGFLFAFRSDIVPALQGWWNLFLISIDLKTPPFDATFLLPGRITGNVIIYFGMFLISVFVVAQFTLPVSGLKDRYEAFLRLLLYVTAFRGPAVFVGEGKLIKRVGEEDNINPGVALVDLRSAIILENIPSSEEENYEELNIKPTNKKKPWLARQKTMQKTNDLEQESWVRIGGPGINFTSYGERIRDVVDLRKQVRTETGVKAFTRDGIEVQTNIFTVFSLSEPPDIIDVAYVGGRGKEHLFELKLIRESNGVVMLKEKFPLDSDDAEEIHQFVELGHTVTGSQADNPSGQQFARSPYAFDSQRVFSAAYGQTLHVGTGKNTQWHELPQLIAAELFRNLLGRYTYDYLYPFGDVDSTKSLPWLDELKPELGRKLKYQGLLSYRLVRLARSHSLSGGRTPSWNEYPLDDDVFGHVVPASGVEISISMPLTNPKSLRDRGIKVIFAGFSELKVSAEMRSKMAERWRTRWDRDIAFNRARQEREAMQIINSARTQTQRDSAYFLSNMLKQEPHSKEALALLLFQSLEAAATNEKGYKDFPPKEVLAMLQNLHRWLLIERQEIELKRKKNAKDDGQHTGSPPTQESGGS